MKTVTFQLDMRVLTIIVGICGFLILLLVGGSQFMNYREGQKIVKRQQIMDICENDAFNFYDQEWSTACAGIGQQSDCRLPNASAVLMDSRKNQRKADCLKGFDL